MTIKNVIEERIILHKHKNILAFSVILFAVILGNLVWVLGLRNPNPAIEPFSGMTSSSGQIIPGQYTIDTNIAYTTQTLGKASARLLLSGHMPYWNYYEGIGSPLAGEMQSAALFPFTLLLILANGVLFEHIILEVIAGYFTYLFFKKLGLKSKSALLAGAIFSLNGTFAWIDNAAFNPIAFLPVMLFGLEYLIDEKIISKNWLWLPIGLALSLYAGFPETAYIDALFVVLWGLLRLWQTHQLLSIKRIWQISRAFIIGILLSAPILILFADYLPNAYLGNHANNFIGSLPHLALPIQVLPYLFGTIGNAIPMSGVWAGIGGYVSISVVLLATIGLFSKISWKIKLILIFWIASCLLKSYGFQPVVELWNLIPAIKNAAFYRYCMPSVYFASTILAAYGIDNILKHNFSRKRLMSAYLVFAAFLIILFVLAIHFYPLMSSVPGHKYFSTVFSIAWATAISCLIAAAIITVKPKYLYQTIFLLVFIDVWLMFFIPTLSTNNGKLNPAPINFLKTHLGVSRFYTLGPIQPNYGSYYKISEIDTNDLPTPKLWVNYFMKSLDTNTNPITFVGSFRQNPNGPSAFEEFLNNEKNFEYVDTKYLVSSRNQINKEQIQQARLTLSFSNNLIDIYRLPKVGSYYTATSDCKILKKSVSLRNISANCSGKGILRRKELYMPGWRASVNGKTVPVKKYNNLFQSINLNKGKNYIKFIFIPPYIFIGWLLFLLSASGLLFYIFRDHLNLIQSSIKRNFSKFR